MLGRKERDQLELFITGSLRQLVPDDHVLARVDRVLDLSWLRVGGRRPLLRDERAAGDRSRGRGPADARGLPARHRARPAADARGAGQSRDPLVRRLRPARGPARPFLADPHPPALGRRALPAHLRADGEGLRRGEDRQGRDRPYRRLADPRRRELGEPGRPPRRGGRRGERRRRDGGAGQPQDRQAQEGLRHRSGRDDGDQRAQPAARAGLQAARCGRRRLRAWSSTSRSRPARSTRARSCLRASTRRRDDRRADPDGDGGRRLRLRQGLRRARAARDRRR